MSILRLVCISDTHNQLQNVEVPDGDILIHSGDLTNGGTLQEMATQLTFFGQLPHKIKLYVSGNHDFLAQEFPNVVNDMCKEHGITLLNNKAKTINGIKFYGNPTTPLFGGWAFMVKRDSPEMEQVWKQIPSNTNVLITHGPAYGKLDFLPGAGHLGCEKLASRIVKLNHLLLHQFGHIHFRAGVEVVENTWFANASTCGENYAPTNLPIVFDLNTELKTLTQVF